MALCKGRSTTVSPVEQIDDDVPQLPGCEASPNGPELLETDEPEWTPEIAWRRALVWGGVAALVTTLVSAPVAWFFPYVLLIFIVRAFLALVVTWAVFAVVHRAAGMVGPRYSALGVALAVAVFLSHHIVIALHGLAAQPGLIAGVAYLAPLTLLTDNISTFIGVGAGALLCYDGGGSLGTLTDILTQGVFGTSRWPR